MARQGSDNWLICTSCQGSGYQQDHYCAECQGQGVGWLGDDFWLSVKWSTSKLDLWQKKIIQKFLLIIDLIIYVIAVSGWLALFWQLGANSNWFTDWSTLSTLAWWTKASWPLKWIAWSALFNLLAVYRLVQNSRPVIVPRLPSNRVQKPDSWSAVHRLPQKNKFNLIKFLPKNIQQGLDQAASLAIQSGYGQISVEQWFLILLNDQLVKSLLFRLNLSGQEIADKLSRNQPAGQSKQSTITLSLEVRASIIQGVASAWVNNEIPLSVDFLAPLIRHSQLIREVIFDVGAKPEQFIDVANWFHINRQLAKNYQKMRGLAQFKPGSNMDRAYTAVDTPFLNQHAHDLTLAAKNNQLPLCVARQDELNQILETWASGRAGIVVSGSEGIGKRSLVYGLAQLMVQESVPRFLQDKRLVEIDLATLLGGSSAEEAQSNLNTIIAEVNRAGNIILFIDHIEKIVGLTSGSEQSLDLSDVLSNALQRGYLRCITTIEPEDHRQVLARRSLGTNLAKIDLDEPDDQQMMTIAQSWASYWESRWKVTFTYPALEVAKLASQRYLSEPAQPTRFLSILEASARLVAGQRGRGIIDNQVVREYVSQTFGVPMQQVGQEEGKMLLTLEKTIHQRLIGQEEAVSMVAASLRRARVELRDKGRPIANFLFLGPTGVGKTELAKTLAEVYFGDDQAMIRLDMSEYQRPDSVNKIIGASGETSYLIESVRQKPFSLVLLDELEKAHPDILNLFLQIFDDGRLTDNQGRTVDFSNTIIITTSNIGAQYIMSEVQAGTDIEVVQQHLIDHELAQAMRPELINRFDGVVVFKPLSLENMLDIARLQFRKIEKQLAEKNINFQVTEAGLAKIAQTGYDPKFGARPLRRLLQDTISNDLAEKLLAKQLKRRDTVVLNDQGQIEVVSATEL